MLGLGFDLTSLAARQRGGAAFGAGTPAGILLGDEPSGLAIDFAQESALVRGHTTQFSGTPTDLLTYTSPSPKLVYGSDGVLRYAPHNLALQSDDMSVTWTALNVTASKGGVLETTDNGQHRVGQTITTLTGMRYTFRAKIRPVGGRDARIIVAAGTVASVVFGLTGDGSIVTGDGTISGPDTDGFYTCAATGVADSSSVSFYINSMVGTTSSFAGDVTKGLDIKNVHVFRAPADDTYLPTTSAARYAIPLDHDPLTGDPLGVLIEPQRTNLFTNSDMASGTSPSNVSNTDSSVPSPIGGLNFRRVEAISSDTTSFAKTISSSGSASGNTLTFFVKKGSGATDANRFLLRNSTTATNVAQCSIDYDTGVVATALGTCDAEELPGGVWRLRLTATSGVSNGDNLTVYCGFIGSSESAGEYLLVTGAQLEAGAFPTSYIPTAGSQVTRARDQVSLSGSKFPLLAAEGSMFVAGDVLSIPQGVHAAAASLNNGTAAKETLIMAATNGTTNLACQILDTSVQANLNGLGSVGLGNGFRTAIAYAEDDCAAISNGGGGLKTDTSATMPAVDQLWIGHTPTLATWGHHGHIKSLVYIPRRASNDELQELVA